MTTLEQSTLGADDEKKDGLPEMTPTEAIESFEWNKKYLETGFHEPLITDFCDRTKETLGLNSDEVEGYLKDAMELSTKVFRTLFIEEGGARQDLKYHNDVHAKLTTVVGTELFLGALEELSKDNEFSNKLKDDPQLASKLVKTATYAFALHEYKDWWDTDQPEEKTKICEKLIAEGLSKEGININDVGLILELDAFGKDLDDSIAKTREPDFKADFVPSVEDEASSLLSGKKEGGLSDSLIKIYGSCLRTADYSQVLNPNYLEEINLINEDRTRMDKNPHFKGPVILANEFSYRPKAFPDNWVRANDQLNLEIVWSETGIEKSFYEEEIKKNINYGIEFMKNFNLEQYNGMKKAMEKIEMKIA